MAEHEPAAGLAAARGMDIYLLDQLLRGRIQPGTRVLEVGCGSGRNLVYFLQAGYDVGALDREPAAIRGLRALASKIAPHVEASSFRAERVEETTFAEESADLVISCAVLHFAKSDREFESVLFGSWRLVAPGGVLFCRLASTIGLEGRFVPIEGRRFRQPDGSERYLVDEAMLLELTAKLGGELLDPIKTTVVQDQRCMTTWVLRKPS